MSFGTNKTAKQLYNQRIEEASIARTAKKEGQIGNMRQWLADQDWKDAHPKPLKNKVKVVHLQAAPRRTRQRGSAIRSSASSGDSNNAANPEPPRGTLLSLNLYDQATLAAFLAISKKTLQNLYSTKPHTLPVAIHVPGARGPRWTHKAVQEWLEQRPQHTPKPKPVSPGRKVGRPRIALVAGKGGAK